MALPEVVARDEWVDARRKLLVEEKALTRQMDVVNAARRSLPMVEVVDDYVFDGPAGTARLRDLFGEHRQLVVYHFMFHPAWDKGCPGCTALIDSIAPKVLDHLAQRSTAFVVMSRAPLSKIAEYRNERGWTLPWYSSNGSSFNFDFGVSIDESVRPVAHNFRTPDELASTRDAWLLDPANQPAEVSGISCFLRDGERIFHTYTTYQRGTEPLIQGFNILDMTALGRQERWELPDDRVAEPGPADPSFGGWGPNGPGGAVDVEIRGK